MFQYVRWDLQRRWERLTARNLPIILLYHRISDAPLDPFRLSVTEEHFAQQIEALCRMRRVVSLNEILDADAGQHRGRPLAAITFDDGYRSVITKALPILEAHGCPSTFFVCSGAIDSPREFWWDELVRIVFERPLPMRLSLRTAVGTHVWLTGSRTASPGKQALCEEIWAVLVRMDPFERIRALDDFARQTGVELKARDEFRIATRADLASLEGSGMVVGAHTISHPNLPHRHREDRKREIHESLEFCRSYAGGRRVHFSYPFGAHDNQTVELIGQMGFASAVTTIPGVVRKSANPMRLPRYGVYDWDAQKFCRTLPLAPGSHSVMASAIRPKMAGAAAFRSGGAGKI